MEPPAPQPQPSCRALRRHARRSDARPICDCVGRAGARSGQGAGDGSGGRRTGAVRLPDTVENRVMLLQRPPCVGVTAAPRASWSPTPLEARTAKRTNKKDEALVMTSTTSTQDIDAVVIGSGFAGLYMNYRLRDQLGM